MTANARVIRRLLGGDIPQQAVDNLPETVAALEASIAVASTDGLRPTNAQAADYSLVIGDLGKAVQVDSATAKAVTVPPNATVAFPVGAVIEVVRAGAGAVSLVAGAGVTITGDTEVPAQGASLLLRKTGTNAWWSSIVGVRTGTYPQTPDGNPAVALVVDANQQDAGSKSFNIIRSKRKPYVSLDHPDFGFNGNGIDSDSAALALATEECLGTADPATNTRRSKGPLGLPPDAIITVTEPWVVKSALGFHLSGPGKEAVQIKPVGVLSSVLDLNGVSRSTFGGFSVAGNGTETITEVIRVRHGTGVARTTNFSTLHDIAINAPTRYVTGIRLGEDGDNTQVDTVSIRHCNINGGWTDGETTYWQQGLYVGSGVSANNLDHKGYDLSLNSCRYNLRVDRSQFALFGVEFGGGESDIAINGGTSGYVVVRAGRSETSQRLLACLSASTAPVQIAIEDIDWRAGNVAVDGRVINMILSGNLYLKNLRLYDSTGSGVPPVLWLKPSAGGFLAAEIDGLALSNTLVAGVACDANSQARIAGFQRLVSGGGIDPAESIAGTVFVTGATTQRGHGVRTTGDAYPRLASYGDGSLRAGTGAAAEDATLRRGGVGYWSVPMLVKAAGTPTDADYATAPSDGVLAVAKRRAALFAIADGVPTQVSVPAALVTALNQTTGGTSNTITAPDAAVLRPATELELVTYCTPTVWAAPAATGTFMAKEATGQRSFRWQQAASTGRLVLNLSTDGSAFVAATSTATPSAMDGTALYLKATWRKSDGRVQFFTSTDGATWTQLGSNVTVLSGSDLFAGTAPLYVGSRTGSDRLDGRLFRAIMRTAIDGAVAFDANFSAITPTAARIPATFVESSANAATVTIGGTNWSWSREADPVAPVTIPDGSLTDAKISPSAAIAESKLALASDAVAATASRRSIGTGATQAAAGNHGHAGVATIARSTSDQPILDTTQTNLTNVSAAIAADQIMTFEAVVYYDSTTANDLRLSVTVPAGATVQYGIYGVTTSATSSSGSFTAVVATSSGSVISLGGGRAAGASAVRMMAVLRGVVVNGSTAGTIQVRAGKLANTDATSPADDLTVFSGSHMIATPA